MIAGCPTCAARYRIDTAKLRPEGARLRCSRCETVFRVRPPAGAQRPEAARPVAPVQPAGAQRPEATPAVAPAQPAAPAHAAAERLVPAAPAAAAAGARDLARLVLIAHPETAAGKALADAVAGWGCSPLLVHDGVEAILQIQRALPRVVVLDAALPRMFGFQICELMKRNEQLREIPVVLVGAIHDQSRYRRAPEELYGADAYVERQQLPDALAELLTRFGLPLAGAPAAAPRPAATPTPRPAATPAPRPAATPTPRPAATPTPRAPAPAAPAASPEAAQAERLARIIVSDVILYNQEKFDAALRAGNVVEALAAELEEGCGLLVQRVGAGAGDPRELLRRELLRVAHSRGMRG